MFFDVIFFCSLVFIPFYLQTIIYLFGQAQGQFKVLYNTQSIQSFKKTNPLSPNQIQNLNLVEQIKKYSVDSLYYLPTDNFSKIVNQFQAPSLWVITASEAFSLKPYYWYFPIVGRVNYKGFFDKIKAQAEALELQKLGYDTELSAVSAWSTLGWFSDPILSNTLKYEKGQFCNLLFHELFHATYYAPSSVNFNENITSFIAHKATIQFLKEDTVSLDVYLTNYNDNLKLEYFMLEQAKALKMFYKQTTTQKNKIQLKQQYFSKIAEKLMQIQIKNKRRLKEKTKALLKSKNAYFIGFEQYHGLQDSLEIVFNKNYKGQLKKLVQHLKLNGINY